MVYQQFYTEFVITTHPVLTQSRVAVITGAASGIGLAASKRLASLGMKVCMVDIIEDELHVNCEEVAKLAKNGSEDVFAAPADVSRLEDLQSVKEAVYRKFGEVGLLMNNAATRSKGSALENYENWQRALGVNLWGVIHGVQTFVPAMIAQQTPCLVVNTGSKQGITTPPGNTAYNVTKAGLKAYTEGLQHELRNIDGCQVTAHLLIPGWTTTGKRDHQPGAWLPDQVIDVLLSSLEKGDFYILCPDNEVTLEMDKQRILWAAGDIISNRPPLSRWHPDYTEEFKKFSSSS